MNSKVDRMASVQNANFRALRGGFSFVRLPLAEIDDRLGRLPQGIVQGSVELRCMIDADCLGHLAVFFAIIGCRHQTAAPCECGR